ncbi:MAG: hypothetical protein R3Y13_04480 [bacterium]
MQIILSRLYNKKYKEYEKILEYFTNGESLEGKNFFDVLYYTVNLCELVPALNAKTLKNVTNFIYNVNLLQNSPTELEDYLYYYNDVITSLDEYKLFNTNLSMNCDNKYKYAAMKGLMFLYKKALFDVSFIKEKEHYLDISIDALMVAKGKKFNLAKDNIIINEILHSSYARINNINYLSLINVREEKLLKLHEKCKEYANKSIASGLYTPNKGFQINDVYEGSFLVRRIDYHDYNEVAELDLSKDRLALNCSVITPYAASVYPDLYEKVIFGYSDIHNHQILFISPYDAYTSELLSVDELSSMSDTNNMFLSLEDLNTRTAINNHYNELVILRKDDAGNTLDPSYILIRSNEKDNSSISAAEELDVPLVRMKTKNVYNDEDQLLHLF